MLHQFLVVLFYGLYTIPAPSLAGLLRLLC